MKRIATLILAALLVFALCACGKATPAATETPSSEVTTPAATEPTAAPTAEPTTAPTTEPTTAPTTEPTTEATTAEPVVEPAIFSYSDPIFGFTLTAPSGWVETEGPEQVVFFVIDPETSTNINVTIDSSYGYDAETYVVLFQNSISSTFDYTFEPTTPVTLGNSEFLRFKATANVYGVETTQYVYIAIEGQNACVIAATARNGEEAETFEAMITPYDKEPITPGEPSDSYTNIDFGFTFNVPLGWTEIEYPGSDIAFANIATGSVIMFTVSSSEGLDENTYIDLTLSELRKIGLGYEIDETRTPVMIGASRFQRVTAHVSSNGVDNMDQYIYIAVIGEKACVISATTVSGAMTSDQIEARFSE